MLFSNTYHMTKTSSKIIALLKSEYNLAYTLFHIKTVNKLKVVYTKGLRMQLNMLIHIKKHVYPLNTWKRPNAVNYMHALR